MDFKYKFFLLAFLLLGISCNKTELPSPVEENPVFTISAQLDGQALELDAGIDDYYLFTEYRQDDLGIYSFLGKWAKTSDCEVDCLESLEVEIRDFKISTATVLPMIDQALAPATLSYVTPDSMIAADTTLLGYEIAFENKSIANFPLNYLWDFGDNSTSSQANPTPHFYPVSNVNNPPIVTLSVSDSPAGGVCNSSVVKELILNAGHQPETCSIVVQVVGDSTFFNACASMSGTPPFTYEWMTDNGQTNTSVCALFSVVDSSFNVYLKGTDANACTATKQFNLQSNPNTTVPIVYCSADFGYTVTEKMEVDNPTVDSLHLSQVIIRYTDPSGTLFTSNFAGQSSTNKFEILESTDHEANEKGEKTRLLKVRFACLLQSANGKMISLENAVGTVAVAYP